MWVFIDDVLEYSEQMSQTWIDYVSSELVLQTVEDTTYFVNPDIVVELLDKTDDTAVPLVFFQRVSHINVTAALNYGETVQVNITKSNGDRHTISYTVPD